MSFSLFLLPQVADLRLALQRAEQQTARKEDYFRQEIGELQQVLGKWNGFQGIIHGGVKIAGKLNASPLASDL